MVTILHTESSTGWGGQEIRIVEESLGMIKRGYRAIIASPQESIIYKKVKEHGIAVFHVGFQKKNPASILRLISLINKESPDIVNTHSSSDSWIATIAVRLSKTRPKVLRTRHLSTPISKSFLSRLIYNILPDAVITTGEEIRQRMINDNGFDSSKIFSIPTGIDLERFNPVRVKAVLQSKNLLTYPFNKRGKGGFFSIGMIGVLRSWKGHKYFIEAMPEILNQIPDAIFYIVGDGPQEDNIKNFIHNLSLREKVFMLGHREDIPELLSSLNVMVQPSYANEGVPQSILQALAMEKPVIASDAGSIKEVVIDRKTGFLIEPRNPAQLAEKVIELYRNPELMVKFGKEGRRLVEENYSIEKMLNKMEALYERLLR